MQVVVELHGFAQRAASPASGDGAWNSGITQVLEKDGETMLRRLERFGFRDRILRPIQKHASDVGILGSQGDWRFFRLVANFQAAFGIDFGGQGIHRREGEERGRLHNAVPMERIDPSGISGGPDGVSAVVGAGFEGADGAAVFIVAQAPQENDAGEREYGRNSSAGTAAAGADFPVDETEEQWEDQSQNQKGEHDWFDNEDDVPRIPLLGKGPKRAYAVVVGEVEQDVTQSGEAGVEEEQAPARGQLGVFDFAAAEAPWQVDEGDYDEGVERDSQKRVGESAMVGEAECRAAKKAANYVQVRSFCGEGQRERG